MGLPRRLIAGNWKMNMTAAEGAALARAVVGGLGARTRSEAARPERAAEVVLLPPFTALGAVAGALSGSDVGLGAQNLHWEAQGAFTGEVSAAMLLELGCRYVLIGHSERRHIMGETDEVVEKKLGAALAAGLRPILCVGETLAERDAGRTEAVVGRQLAALAALAAPAPSGRGDDGARAARAARLVVAYEPVWAIGTGRAAAPADAARVLEFARRELLRHAGAGAGDVRVLYGGSVKPQNAGEFFTGAGFDGALVGGASLDSASFCAIVSAAG